MAEPFGGVDMLALKIATCQRLVKVVQGMTGDPSLREDLLQEAFIQFWKMECQRPGQTLSWYLQNCRFHLQHWLAAGRSLDSVKRAGANRTPIEAVQEGLGKDGYHSNAEFLESVCARDLVSALVRVLKPDEGAVLKGLAEGLLLREVATKLNLSYPTALKYRRKIASLTLRLGIEPPPPYRGDETARLQRIRRKGGRAPATRNGV